jgi:hypothetical protein
MAVSRWCRDVREAFQELAEGSLAVVDGGLFVVGQRGAFPLECGHLGHWTLRVQRKRCHAW